MKSNIASCRGAVATLAIVVSAQTFANAVPRSELARHALLPRPAARPWSARVDELGESIRPTKNPENLGFNPMPPLQKAYGLLQNAPADASSHDLQYLTGVIETLQGIDRHRRSQARNMLLETVTWFGNYGYYPNLWDGAGPNQVDNIEVAAHEPSHPWDPDTIAASRRWEQQTHTKYAEKLEDEAAHGHWMAMSDTARMIYNDLSTHTGELASSSAFKNASVGRRWWLAHTSSLKQQANAIRSWILEIAARHGGARSIEGAINQHFNFGIARVNELETIINKNYELKLDRALQAAANLDGLRRLNYSLPPVLAHQETTSDVALARDFIALLNFMRNAVWEASTLRDPLALDQARAEAALFKDAVQNLYASIAPQLTRTLAWRAVEATLTSAKSLWMVGSAIASAVMLSLLPGANLQWLLFLVFSVTIIALAVLLAWVMTAFEDYWVFKRFQQRLDETLSSTPPRPGGLRNSPPLI